MKYIFVAGAPGSKWSSVVKNIYFSSDIDQSDNSDQRSYSHAAAYNGQPMHIGSYFDPGMEYGSWFDRLDQHSQQACEIEFDRPFSGQGTRIIKSHMFCHHVDFIKQTWPDCPIILVHRDDDACLGWWVRCGAFDISYPNYRPYYKDIETIYQEIIKQNYAMQPFLAAGSAVNNNIELCDRLKIAHPPAEYVQRFIDHKVQVNVL